MPPEDNDQVTPQPADDTGVEALGSEEPEVTPAEAPVQDLPAEPVTEAPVVAELEVPAEPVVEAPVESAPEPDVPVTEEASVETPVPEPVPAPQAEVPADQAAAPAPTPQLGSNSSGSKLVVWILVVAGLLAATAFVVLTLL